MPPREAQVTTSGRSATPARLRAGFARSAFAWMVRAPLLEQLHVGRVTRRVDSEPRLTRLGVHCDEVHPRAWGWTDRGLHGRQPGTVNGAGRKSCDQVGAVGALARSLGVGRD